MGEERDQEDGGMKDDLREENYEFSDMQTEGIVLRVDEVTILVFTIPRECESRAEEGTKEQRNVSLLERDGRSDVRVTSLPLRHRHSGTGPAIARPGETQNRGSFIT